MPVTPELPPIVLTAAELAATAGGDADELDDVDERLPARGRRRRLPPLR